MKRVLVFLLLLSTQLAAIEVLTEAKVGYFLPTDAKFTSIYGEDGIVGGLESSFSVGNNFWPWIGAWMYINEGHTRTHHESHILFIPVSLGLKYIYPFKYLSVYGGAGVTPTYMHVDHHSKLGGGGTVKVGFIADRLWNFFIDLFAEYSYLRMPHHHNLTPANLSNFTIGGGVGYHFGGCYRECDDDDD